MTQSRLRSLHVLIFLLPLVLPVPLVFATEWTVCFTPGENCTETVVKTIDRSQRTVYVQAYSFTSVPIAKALMRAEKRGIQVAVILDKSNRAAQYSAADFIAHQGIPTYIDAQHAIAHSKVIVLDEETVITGSFNFTTAAQEHNAENLLVIHDRAVATRYLDNWKRHRAHSERYAGRRSRE